MNKRMRRAITAFASGASIISLAFVENMPEMLKYTLLLVGWHCQCWISDL